MNGENKENKSLVILSEADFRKRIKNDANGAFLFFGEEDYLKQNAVEELKKAMGIDESLAFFNYVKLDYLDYTPEKLIDSFSLPPMMADKKLLVLTGLNTNKMRPDEISALTDAIAHIEEFDYNNFVLLMPEDCFNEGYLPKSPSPVLKAFAKLLTPVRFERVTPQKLVPWAMRHFAYHGISVDERDAACLVDYCEKSMLVLKGEIEKLVLYIRAHGRSKMEKQDIFEVCCADMEYDSFDFANAILSNKRSDALKTLSAMKLKQITSIQIMAELSAIYCDLASTKVLMLAGKGLDAIKPIFKNSEYRAKIYMRTASVWDLETLKRLVKMCVDADAEIKRSDNSYLPLEKLICSI